MRGAPRFAGPYNHGYTNGVRRHTDLARLADLTRLAELVRDARSVVGQAGSCATVSKYSARTRMVPSSASFASV